MTSEYRPEQLPPQNLHAERSVLGSMLRDNMYINDVVKHITADNFYTDAHQKIFTAITAIYNSAQPVDLVILAERLKLLKQIEDVGGYKYLAELWESAPTAANAEYYAKIVREKAIVRNLIHAGTEILRDCYDQVQSADELLSAAERKVLDIAEKGSTGEATLLQQALHEAYGRIDMRSQRDPMQTSGISTGYADLNQLTGGFQPSELIILAARPSVGKTACALNMIRHMVVDHQIPVLFVSLEQARVELAERLLCMQARVNSHRLRTGSLDSEDMQKLLEAGELLRPAPMYIDDAPMQTMTRIAATARRLHHRNGLKMVAIDYLQLIEPENRRDSRQEQVAQISRRLKFLARELAIPVMALAQVNRGSEDRQDHRPRLSDLRESGSIEQDADTVFLLHRKDRVDPAQPNDEIELIVGKQRNGPTGEIMLTYVRSNMRYENYAPDTLGGYS
jgi:replicative DNA helicase